MKIGVPKEIKNHEYRVGMTPSSVREATAHGHSVMVQANAGEGIGASDDDYRSMGATIIDEPADIFAAADMIVKVKEPQSDERKMLREGQILFTYLHLAPDPEQTKDLVESGATCIAYETVTSPFGGLPLLAPMSKVAGRMAIQAGAHCLEHHMAGKAFCSGAFRALTGARSLFWVPASWANMRQPLRWVWARMFGLLTEARRSSNRTGNSLGDQPIRCSQPRMPLRDTCLMLIW